MTNPQEDLEMQQLFEQEEKENEWKDLTEIVEQYKKVMQNMKAADDLAREDQKKEFSEQDTTGHVYDEAKELEQRKRSLESQIGKIIERRVKKRLDDLYKKNKKLPYNHYRGTVYLEELKKMKQDIQSLNGPEMFPIEYNIKSNEKNSQEHPEKYPKID